MICGHCKHPGATLEHVRSCAGVANPAPSAPTQPAQTAPRLTKVDVPAGRYAVEYEGVLRFYKVDRPTEGRWKGYTFVKRYMSDDLVQVRGKESAVVQARIFEDVKAAMLRFGREIGKCGHCGRTLTDPDSRARGIGPVCAEHLGGF